MASRMQSVAPVHGSYVVVRGMSDPGGNSCILLSEEASNESEWALFGPLPTATPTDVLSSITSSSGAEEEEDLVGEYVMRQSVVRVENWLRRGFIPSTAKCNRNGPPISVVIRLLRRVEARKGLIKACSVEYRRGAYTKTNRLTLGALGVESEGMLMANPDLDAAVPEYWRRVLDPMGGGPLVTPLVSSAPSSVGNSSVL